MGRLVEAGRKTVSGERGAYVRVRVDQVAELAPLVGGSHRVPLDDRVGVLAREPAVLEEGRQEPAAGVESQAAGDVLEHALRADDEAVHQ